LHVQWTDEAKANLRAIESYISRDNPKAAAKTILKILKRTNSQFNDHPSSGKSGRITGTRELIFPEFPYIVIYTVHGKKISIITVFHSAQNITNTEEK
jgi:toxin ParE1/3/4